MGFLLEVSLDTKKKQQYFAFKGSSSRRSVKK